MLQSSVVASSALVLLNVTAGMVQFSVIQFFAKAWCALQWWEFVRWRIFWCYCWAERQPSS
jgi:hypothetical protein